VNLNPLSNEDLLGLQQNNPRVPQPPTPPSTQTPVPAPTSQVSKQSFFDSIQNVIQQNTNYSICTKNATAAGALAGTCVGGIPGFAAGAIGGLVLGEIICQ
jgi:hypothetical protein